MKHADRMAYYQSQEWKALRARTIDAAGGRCRLCNRPSHALHAHHRTYERFGHELDDDITILCAACHKAFHQERGGVDKGRSEAAETARKTDKAIAAAKRKACEDERRKARARLKADTLRRARATPEERAFMDAERQAADDRERAEIEAMVHRKRQLAVG